MTQLAERAAEDDVIIPFAGEPLTSQPFIEEYNRNRAIEKELRQTLQQSGEELRTMPQITSLFHSTQGTIYTQIGKFRTL